jgi:AbrB family looped-hinge helix DNA binding protein
MITTKLSSKGQVIIPKHLRHSYHWAVGQDLVVIDTGNGILLKAKTPFPETTLDQVAACLKYTGEPKSLDDMEDAIRKGAMEQFNDLG